VTGRSWRRRSSTLSTWEAGVAFSLDGGADIVGSNSYLARFRSVADSFLDHSVEGEHVYTNPDFELILKYIVHFLEGQRIEGSGENIGNFRVAAMDVGDVLKSPSGCDCPSLHPAGGAFVHEPGVEDRGCMGEAAGSGG
jgi:hypothetical protein